MVERSGLVTRQGIGLVGAWLVLACAPSAPREPARTVAEAPPTTTPSAPAAAAPSKPNVWEGAKVGTVVSASERDRPDVTNPLTLEIGRAKLRFGEAQAWRQMLTAAEDPRRTNASGPATPEQDAPFKAIATIPFGKSHLTFAEMSQDGRWVVAESEAEGVLRQYDAQSGKLLAKLAVPGFEPYGTSGFLSWPLEPSRPLVLQVNARGHRLLDVAQGTVTEVDQVPGWALRLSESERFVGTALTSAEQTSTLRFARPTPAPALEPALTVELSERVDDWVLTRDERLLALLFYPSSEVEILDLESQRVVGVVETPQYAASIHVTPDEHYLAVGGAALWVYDLTTGERVATDERFDNNIGRVRFSPSGDRLVVTAYDGRARSYPFSGGRLGERQVLPHRGTANVYAASFSRDGLRLVTSSGDQTLKVWER